MQGRVIDGPLLLLRTSAEEYATIRKVFAFVPHMDRAIIGYQQMDIDRLASRLAEAAHLPGGGRELRLARGHLACLSSIFAAAYPPLSREPQVSECDDQLMEFLKQLGSFVDRQWAAEDSVH